MNGYPEAHFDYPEGLDLQDQLVFGVGALVIQWADCETAFYGILETLVGRPNSGVGIVVWEAVRNTRDRLDLVAHLTKAQSLPPALEVAVGDAVARFRSVSKVRNFYCHAEYQSDDAGLITRIVSRKLIQEHEPLSLDSRPVGKGMINDIANTIRAAASLKADALRLIYRLQDELAVSQPELPQGLREHLDTLARPKG